MEVSTFSEPSYEFHTFLPGHLQFSGSLTSAPAAPLSIAAAPLTNVAASSI